MDTIINGADKKGYDPVAAAGMKIGNILLLAGLLCLAMRLLIVTFTTAGMMQGFLAMLVVSAMFILAGGAVYLLVGIKSVINLLMSKNDDRKKECKIMILKSCRVVISIVGAGSVLLTSNSGIDLMPLVYLCIATVAVITAIVLKKR